MPVSSKEFSIVWKLFSKKWLARAPFGARAPWLHELFAMAIVLAP